MHSYNGQYQHRNGYFGQTNRGDSHVPKYSNNQWGSHGGSNVNRDDYVRREFYNNVSAQNAANWKDRSFNNYSNGVRKNEGFQQQFYNNPVRGRFLRPASVNHGTRREPTNSVSTAASASTDAVQNSAENKNLAPVNEAYRQSHDIDDDFIDAVRLMTDNVTLVTAAKTYLDNNTPKKKTVNQIAKEVAAAERQAQLNASYRADAAKREVAAALKRAEEAKRAAEAAEKALKLAESAKLAAEEEEAARKRAWMLKKESDIKNFARQEKQRAVFRAQGFDAEPCFDDDMGSSDEEILSTWTGSEDNLDIAIADGLASPIVKKNSSHYIPDETLFAVRQMSWTAEVKARKNKKGNSKVIIHRAELAKRAMQKENKKKAIAAEKKALNESRAAEKMKMKKSEAVEVEVQGFGSMNINDFEAMKPVHTDVTSVNGGCDGLNDSNIGTGSKDNFDVAIADGIVSTSLTNQVPLDQTDNLEVQNYVPPTRIIRRVSRRGSSLKMRVINRFSLNSNESPKTSATETPSTSTILKLDNFIKNPKICAALNNLFSEYVVKHGNRFNDSTTSDDNSLELSVSEQPPNFRRQGTDNTNKHIAAVLEFLKSIESVIATERDQLLSKYNERNE